MQAKSIEDFAAQRISIVRNSLVLEIAFCNSNLDIRKDYKSLIGRISMEKEGKNSFNKSGQAKQTGNPLACQLSGINKSGQATIFIIIAVVLVAAVVIVALFFPDITQTITGQEFSPNGFLRDCVSPIVGESVSLLSKQGGYANPEGFALYNGEKVKYLCYTSEYYQTCAVQQPMIKNKFEKELKLLVENRANSCISNLKTEYEKRGFSVSASTAKSVVQIKPSFIRIDFDSPMTVTKDTTRTFEGFSVDLNSGMYELLFVAQSIVDFESTYGDSETNNYLQYYPDLKIEKTKLGDGTTIYKLSNVVTKEEFTFASRSLAWPPGFGTE